MAAATKTASKTRSTKARAATEAHMDQALALIREAKGNVHAKDIQAGLGLNDRDGDRLYLAMKDDPRFVKNEPRKATYGLTAKGKRAKV